MMVVDARSAPIRTPLNAHANLIISLAARRRATTSLAARGRREAAGRGRCGLVDCYTRVPVPRRERKRAGSRSFLRPPSRALTAP